MKKLLFALKMIFIASLLAWLVLKFDVKAAREALASANLAWGLLAFTVSFASNHISSESDAVQLISISSSGVNSISIACPFFSGMASAVAPCNTTYSPVINSFPCEWNRYFLVLMAFTFMKFHMSFLNTIGNQCFDCRKVVGHSRCSSDLHEFAG